MHKPSKMVSWGMAVLVMLLAVGVTYAEDSVYADFAFGRAQVDDQRLNVAVADDTNALRFGLGYDLGNNIALEAAYVNLGDLEDSDVSGPFDGQTDGATLAARFSVPFSRTLNASARVGMFFWESELETPAVVFIDEGEDLFYGVGLDFEVSRNLSFSAQWDRFEFDRNEADVIWAGLRFRF